MALTTEEIGNLVRENRMDEEALLAAICGIYGVEVDDFARNLFLAGSAMGRRSYAVASREELRRSTPPMGQPGP